MSTRFLYNNQIKTFAKSLVADSQQTNYPSANLQTDNYSQTWRTLNASSSHNVVNDFLAAVQIDTVFLGNVNLTSSATVTIQANATDSWGAPSFSEALTISGLGLDPKQRNLYHELSSAQTFQFWRILISDTTNPDGFYEVGEWWLGRRVALATTQQHEIQHTQTFERNNIENVTEYMQKYVYTRAERRVFRIKWEKATATTRDELRKLERFVKGSGLPFVYVLNPFTTPKEGFFVRMSGELVVEQNANDNFDISLTLDEEAGGKSLPVGE
jgi:hypothetical protein